MVINDLRVLLHVLQLLLDLPRKVVGRPQGVLAAGLFLASQLFLALLTLIVVLRLVRRILKLALELVHHFRRAGHLPTRFLQFGIVRPIAEILNLTDRLLFHPLPRFKLLGIDRTFLQDVLGRLCQSLLADLEILRALEVLQLLDAFLHRTLQLLQGVLNLSQVRLGLPKGLQTLLGGRELRFLKIVEHRLEPLFADLADGLGGRTEPLVGGHPLFDLPQSLTGLIRLVVGTLDASFDLLGDLLLALQHLPRLAGRIRRVTNATQRLVKELLRFLGRLGETLLLEVLGLILELDDDWRRRRRVGAAQFGRIVVAHDHVERDLADVEERQDREIDLVRPLPKTRARLGAGRDLAPFTPFGGIGAVADDRHR